MIYLLSPRRGGPYKQLELIATKLNEQGYRAHHCYTILDWLRLHFNRRHTIISVIPFLFVLNRKKFILNIRGNYHKERKLTNPLSFLYDYNVRLAHKVVLPSYYLKKELALNQAVVIPNSTDITIPYSQLEQKHSPPPAVRIATITNFDFRPKAQGISKLINIINQLNSPRPIELHIYGGGKWLNFALDQYTLNNFKKYRVIFHGRFNSAAKVLMGNDIFTYWSVFDNMPNVLTEAIACGLAVVANRYGAYEEILGPKNLIAQNEQTFSQLLLDLINNPTKRLFFQKKNLLRSRLFDINKNIKLWLNTIAS